MKIIDKIIDFVKSIFIHPELLFEGQETKVSEQKINIFLLCCVGLVEKR